MPKKIVDAGLVGKDCLGDIRVVMWNACPLCLLLIIWRERERDNRIFNGISLSTLELKSYFLRSLYGWMSAWDNFHVSS